MRRPLHPKPWVPSLPSHDRLCFSTQIPELGIFIIASPIGRAAIFGITKERSKNKSKTGYIYGFTLENMLPFVKGHPEEVCRPPISPHATLLGVAVGPMQGTFDEPGRMPGPSPSERKWRLLMHFTDHTIISYELSKRRISESCGLGEMVI
jgi:hypothetical protein